MPLSSGDPSFDVAEIRAAERAVVKLLEDPDVSKRVYAYTKDATFVMSGVPTVRGREEMLRRTTTQLYSVALTPQETEGHGNLAYVYGLFSCVTGRTASSRGVPIDMRFLMVWRKEADGVWRIAREFLNANVPPDITETSREVRLREVIELDLPILFEQQWDPEANEMANFPPRDRDAFMAHWKKILADKKAWVRTILFGRDVAGNVVSWEQDGKRLVGYWIGKRFWGKGIASKALSQFLEELTSRPLYAHVAKHNVGSIRVLEKCGFTMCREGAESRDASHRGVEDFVFKLSAGRRL